VEVARVDVVVLGLLAEEPLHGYELIERFRSRALGRWTEVGRASVYQSLKRLEDAGLVEGRGEPGAGGPDRRVYRITRPGRDRLHTGLVERYRQEAGYRSDAAAALGQVHALPPAEAREALAAREEALRALATGAASDRARLASAAGPANAVARSMLDLQERLARSELEWLRGLRRELEDAVESPPLIDGTASGPIEPSPVDGPNDDSEWSS
jgi:DNA-binding PadR family transcriptional regulator